MDMSQYHDLFLNEAREHLKKISELSVVLERSPDDSETIAALFRSAHSVKGMAASMGFNVIAELAHKMEDLMDRVRHGLDIDATLFDLLLSGESCISAMLDDIEHGGAGAVDTAELIARIVAYSSGEKPPELQKQTMQSETDHGEPQKKEEQLFQQTVKVKTSVLDRFVATTGELITVKHRLASIAAAANNKDMADAVESLGKHLREFYNQVMGVRLMPLSVILERFPRMVRDLARKEEKEIAFSISGAEIELDRGILEFLGDPLSHILRNAIDHGIETPAERAAAGKDRVGRLAVAITRLQDQVEIRIEDDGRGMDPEKLAAAAVAKGFVTRDQLARFSQLDKMMLICHPGFSTARKVTDISGRGVGMDVVRTAIQALGGTLAIISEPCGGSSFTLRLPITIAIVNVLLVKTGSLTLAVPLTAVERTMEIKSDDIATIDGQDQFFMGSETIPLVDFRTLLNLNSVAESRSGTTYLFLTELKGVRTGVKVDRLLGNQEVFVKPLARPLSALRGVNGATILGEGEVVFIVDILNNAL